MKKIILMLLLGFTVLCIWIGEDRSFYCIGNRRCITVWKTYGNICYIIPGRYYGLIKPSNSYIKTTNTNNLTIFFTKKSQDELIFKRGGDMESPAYLELNNGNGKHRSIFIDYDTDPKRWDEILYKEDAKKFNDLKDDADFIEIIIKENYATDKNGNKL